MQWQGLLQNIRIKKSWQDTRKGWCQDPESISETSLIKSRNNLVATQLKLYNNNKSSFVAAMGIEEYDNKIIELLNKLPDPDKVPIGCAADENDNEEDDDNDDASDA